MKELDLILRMKDQTDLMDKLERQLRFAQPDITGMIRPSLEMELAAQRGLGIERSTRGFLASSLAKELSAASSAVAAFRMTEESRAFATSAARMSEVTAAIAMQLHRDLQPLRAVMADIGVQFASQFESYGQIVNGMRLPLDQKWVRDMQSATARIAEMARINFAIPEHALLHWPSKVLSDRSQLIEDCVLNAAALETFYSATIVIEGNLTQERLTLATEFVFEHSELVRRVPPGLPELETGWLADDQQHRHEEIGAKLEKVLSTVDPRLLQLRRKAWGNLTGGLAGARLAMGGIRELFDEVLRVFAPDSEVEGTPIWQARTDHKLAKPTRRMQLTYVLGEEQAAEADALLQFDRSIKRTQKFVHTFADDAELVRAQMTHMEIWIFLLLHYGMQGRSE